MHPERALIPQYPYALLGQPVPFPHLGLIQPQVKMPQDLGEKEAHFCVGKLSADTVAGADAEWLRGLATVICKFWVS